MKIGKIKIDLSKLRYNVGIQNKKIIKEYIEEGVLDINKLIEIISGGELTYYTEEDFSYAYIYYYCEFTQITKENLDELKQRKVLNSHIDKENTYANFIFQNGECISPKTGENFKKVDTIPCLIHLDNHIMTYYIFEWDYDDHVLEIED